MSKGARLIPWALVELLTGVALCAGEAHAQSRAVGHPSESELKSTNVQVMASGWMFGGGIIQKDAQGAPACDGLETVNISWQGSAIIARPDGTLVTNWHVVNKAVSLAVRFDTGAIFPVTVIKAYDVANDLAVVRIQANLDANTKFQAAKIGDSDRVAILDPVMAVGNAAGAGLNFTQGNISQIVRDESGMRVRLRHTAVITHGNSGGALYSGSEVIGINEAAGINPTEGGQTGFNVAIPINLARPLLASHTTARLDEVFPKDAEVLARKTQVIGASTVAVPAASQDRPGVGGLRVGLQQLSDFIVTAQGPEGLHLRVAVVEPDSSSLAACGTDALAISTENPLNGAIVVLNPTNNPVNVAVTLARIVW